ncbi:FAD-dependent oxidoreductase [Cellulophaga sp. HaHaR_3_176]|uniref:FAD-binding oxidoreductase n=1 Tax=Cellulophaga sp. HaHaR_3_176 TaxID=1942464 RepID=UPI001C1F52F1|nr:FAD-dependent oxidoreductase [Cellulophaga sp. HaHaR_3_176]QWX85236.1 FAD-dependent oxidoreductase [Cellulophaga sp. HaHaR_3_176]
MHKLKITRCLDNLSENKNIVYPQNTDEIKEVINYCNVNKCSFYPVSSGNNWGYGSSFPSDDETQIVMNLSKMPAVIKFDEEEGLLTFGPGLTQGKLYDFLKANNFKFMVPVTGAGPEGNIMGNALERGFGITPIHDHVASVRCLKAILPNGSTYESPFAQLGLSHLDKHHKWGVGANFDFIFFQSNFGVVYEMTIKLERTPDTIVMFTLSVSNKDIDECLLRLKTIKETYKEFLSGINLMNTRRMLAMKSNYLVEEQGYCSEDKIIKLKEKHRLEDWTVMGAIYGPKSIRFAVKQDIKKALKGIGSKKRFISSNNIIVNKSWLGKLFIDSEDLKKINEGFSILKGKPSRYPLNLIYSLSDIADEHKNYNPLKDNIGIIWFAPVIPFKVDILNKYITGIYKIFKRFNLEPMITLTIQNENIIASTIPILFEKTEKKDVDNAHDLYKCLLDFSLEIGAYPYRLPTIFQKEYLNKLNWEDTIAFKIKSKLDPNNILAPNRYSKS